MIYARWGARVAFVTTLILAMVSAAGAQEAWEKEWQKTLEAAHKEGAVTVSGPPGAYQRRAIISGWEKAFPKIKLEYTGARGTTIISKVVRERLSGIFNWDIVLASTSPTVFSLNPINALAPIRDALIRPDIAQDKTWYDGFEAGFLDKEKRFFYMPSGTGDREMGYVNRACVAEKDFNKIQDLAKPQFVGKISWGDPTRPGPGGRNTWVLSLTQGEDWLKKIFTGHDISFSRDYRQMTDWLINCRRPITIGMPNDVLETVQKEGLGKQVVELLGSAYTGKIRPGGAQGNAAIGWYNNAPHPNAAKIFVNWYLSREFQQHYADIVKDNSRRIDVKSPDPKAAMKQGVAYFPLNDEEATVKIKALQERIKSWGMLKKRSKKK